MTTLTIPESILALITAFHEDWRHPRLPPLEFSGLYSLFPEETTAHPTAANCPDPWPLGDHAGVYLIFGSAMQLLYVGKSACLWRRLSHYFQYSAGRGSACRIVHAGWKTRPMFVATVAVAESFESAALEEYLIGRAHPQENRLFKGHLPSLSDAGIGKGELGAL